MWLETSPIARWKKSPNGKKIIRKNISAKQRRSLGKDMLVPEHVLAFLFSPAFK
jgi:hypothetical protein